MEGLGDGTIRPNLESLPRGLESLFSNWIKPCQFYNSDAMQVLWSFAVLREPFSAREISALTELPINSILGVIQDNSQLFNKTPEGGYTLFHERFNVYVLGTAAHHQLKTIHKDISQSLLNIILLSQQKPQRLVNDAHFLISPRNGTANYRWFFSRLVER